MLALKRIITVAVMVYLLLALLFILAPAVRSAVAADMMAVSVPSGQDFGTDTLARRCTTLLRPAPHPTRGDDGWTGWAVWTAAVAEVVAIAAGTRLLLADNPLHSPAQS